MGTSVQAEVTVAPAPVPAPARVRLPPSEPATTCRGRVLVADDAVEVRVLVRVALEDAGFEVVGEASNGAEAVALAEAHRPDVVLLDVAMPVMDGLEALEALRRRCPSVAVVMHSGFADEVLAERCRRAGAVSYLEKGGELSGLREAVASAVASGPPAPSRAGGVRDRPAARRAPSVAVVRERVVDLPVGRVLRDERWSPLIALVLHLTVFGMQRLLAGNDGPATLSVLHVVPIALLAYRCGLRGGAAGALVACGLFALHLQLRDLPAPTWTAALPILVVYVVVGGCVGVSSERLAQLLRDEQRASQAVVAANQQLVRALDDSRRSITALQVANDDLRQFGYVVSHDLAEPLRTMSGFAGLLEADYADVVGDRGREYLELIRAGSLRMRALIDDLRTYTAAGQRDLDPVPVPLDGVVDHVRQALSATLHERRAVLVRGDLPVVLGDGSMLTLVLQNLVANAVKFNRSPVPTVHVSAQPGPGGSWCVDVQDNGIGIDPAHHDRVFGLFSRLHTREEYPGTGLGLAVAKRVVERHGGRIEIVPAPGGTCFRMTLTGVGPDHLVDGTAATTLPGEDPA